MNFNNLVSELRKYKPEKILFVGLGNELRGDDGAGLIFLNEIKKRSEFNKSNFIYAGRNPENYLQQIISFEPQVVVFIDSADLLEEPGTILFLNSEQIDSAGISTHAFSIKLIEKYLLNELNIEFKYICIQPRLMELHNEISSVISKKIEAFFLQGV